MPRQNESKLAPKLRLKIAAVSLLGLIVPSACASPTPTCYEPQVPTDTPLPQAICYTAPAPTQTPTPFSSPLSPLPTPTPTSTPEPRRLLLDRLLAQGRLPPDVARQLES